MTLLKLSMTTRAFSAIAADPENHGRARGQSPHLTSGEVMVMFKAMCSLGNIVCTLEHCTVKEHHDSDPEAGACQCASLDKLLHHSESLFVYW